MSYKNQSVAANFYRQEIVDLMIRIQSDNQLTEEQQKVIVDKLTDAAKAADDISSYAQDIHDSND